jgi:hypothetical protein
MDADAADASQPSTYSELDLYTSSVACTGEKFFEHLRKAPKHRE